MKRLTAFSNIHTLTLSRTEITDDGLIYLEGLPELRSLDLNATKVTDTGLEHLTTLTQLERLRLRDATVSNAGVKELQKALPYCEIDRSEQNAFVAELIPCDPRRGGYAVSRRCFRLLHAIRNRVGRRLLNGVKKVFLPSQESLP